MCHLRTIRKRGLALFLVSVMCFGMMSTAVFATEADPDHAAGSPAINVSGEDPVIAEDAETVKTDEYGEDTDIDGAAGASDMTEPAGIRRSAAIAEIEDPVAMIDTTPYASLQDAVNAAENGATVTLMSDAVSAKALNIKKPIVLDLNGYTIRRTSASGVAIQVLGGASRVEICGGAVEGATGITVSGVNGAASLILSAVDVTAVGTGKASCAVSVQYGASLVVEDGNLSGQNGIGLYDDNSSVTVNDGVITGVLGGIVGSGLKDSDGSVQENILIINGGRITATGEKAAAVSHPQGGKMTVSGNAEISGATGIELRAGSLEVSGDPLITGTAAEFSCGKGTNGAAILGAAVAVAQGTTKRPISVSISGGTFEGIQALYEANPEKNFPAPKVAVSVTGGMFTGGVSAEDAKGFVTGGSFSEEVGSAFVAEGLYCVQDGGVWVVGDAVPVASVGGANYPSLPSAVNAAKAGDTIKLLADITLSHAMDEGNTSAVLITEDGVTLDGDGHTLVISGDFHGIQVWNAKNVAIKNITITGAGRDALLVNRDSEVAAAEFYTADNTWGAVNVDKNSTFTFESGELTEASKIWADDGESVIHAPSGWNWVEITREDGMVQRVYDPAFGLTLDQSAIALNAGGTAALTAETTPAGVTVDWTSGNEAVASVDENGVVTATGGGSTEITAVAGSLTAVCTVTVSRNAAVVTITPSSVSLTGGGTVILTVSGPEGTEVAASGNQTVSLQEDGTYVVILPNETAVYTFTASFAGNAVLEAASASCTVEVQHRNTSGGGSSGGGSSSGGSSGGGAVTGNDPSGGGLVEIEDPDVPLADLPLPFEDVAEKSWYREAVSYVYSNGLMGGTGKTIFAPDADTTRAMIVQVLHNIEKNPEAEKPAEFTDVYRDQWYTKAVDWGSSTGVVSGYVNGQFGTNDKVSRQDLVTILWNYSKKPASKGTDLEFTDAASISSYALEAMRWAVENGIIAGFQDGTVKPEATATRAEVAQILKNFQEMKAETK